MVINGYGSYGAYTPTRSLRQSDATSGSGSSCASNPNCGCANCRGGGIARDASLGSGITTAPGFRSLDSSGLYPYGFNPVNKDAATPGLNKDSAGGATMQQLLGLFAQLFQAILAMGNGGQQAGGQSPGNQSPTAGGINPGRGALPVTSGGQARGISPGSQVGNAAARANVNDIRGVNDPNLARSLQAISRDPEGGVLLAEAARRGVSIQVGNTGGPNINGFFDPNTNRIVVGDGRNIKTIAHELVHAVTEGDGNSKDEEGSAEVIGRRIESRITGRPLENPRSTFVEKQLLYPELGQSNGVGRSLGRLGISVFA